MFAIHLTMNKSQLNELVSDFFEFDDYESLSKYFNTTLESIITNQRFLSLDDKSKLEFIFTHNRISDLLTKLEKENKKQPPDQP